ncbi:MAG: polysaccharide deacetylase [Lachnospiraceae bacterium]|nr:polysaccharide deacetylase [Lachnospiraceae bacterium]
MSENMKLTLERRKRIKTLKKIIILALFSAIILPSVFCFIFMAKLLESNKQIRGLEERLVAQEKILLIMAEEAGKEELLEIVETSIFHTARLEESSRIGGSTTLNEVSEQVSERKFYLTFDDGPSSNTGLILDILKEYDVKATFFVVGKTDERSFDLYRRIVDEGHTLGMHSYSHVYQEIYQSVEAFSEDLARLQELLYEVTGVWCRYYRFPGGSSNTVSRIEMQVLIDYLTEKDIVYFDWNISSGDAASGYLSTQRIVNNCLSGLSGKTEGIILLHDTAEKSTTVLALPQIIEGILAHEKTVILPITDETLAVQHLN